MSRKSRRYPMVGMGDVYAIDATSVGLPSNYVDSNGEVINSGVIYNTSGVGQDVGSSSSVYQGWVDPNFTVPASGVSQTIYTPPTNYQANLPSSYQATPNVSNPTTTLTPIVNTGLINPLSVYSATTPASVIQSAMAQTVNNSSSNIPNGTPVSGNSNPEPCYY